MTMEYSTTRELARRSLGVCLGWRCLVTGQRISAVWRPALPGETPGELTPEHGPVYPLDLGCPLGAWSIIPSDS